MDEVHKITSLDASWKPGDVVLDAEGSIRVRSDHPKWVWDYPNTGGTRDNIGGPAIPDGALEEKDVPRPLILLVRDGRAVGGQPITADAGTKARSGALGCRPKCASEFRPRFCAGPPGPPPPM